MITTQQLDLFKSNPRRVIFFSFIVVSRIYINVYDSLCSVVYCNFVFGFFHYSWRLICVSIQKTSRNKIAVGHFRLMTVKWFNYIKFYFLRKLAYCTEI